MPTETTLQYLSSDALPTDAETVVLIGRKHRLKDAPWREALGVSDETWAAMLDGTRPGDAGASVSTFAGARKVVLGVLPEVCSRHNSKSRAWAIPALARRASGKKPAAIALMVDHPEHARAATMATARAFPLFNAASGDRTTRTVTVHAIGPDGPVDDANTQLRIDAVRMASRLVDTPAQELHTDAFVQEARAVAAATGATIEVIQGTDLRDQGFGGLWGVGKAATHLPALAVLRWSPPGATRHVAWVGKGVVYDTGGLTIKSKAGMCGMKGDMGGAAAVIGAFQAAALAKVDYAITAVLCLAENAVGPDAVRPDDILTMRSGKTVEINNTDAEGRLCLADGVAWVAEGDAPPDLIIDVATLTGAALVATGKTHAAIYCSDAQVEAAAVIAGCGAGEPCHPLIYAPELFRKEFRSKFADMRNSVKDRGNAQSSCAGQFIANHLPKNAPPYLHIDIAGPAWDNDNRGTGYGVGLLLALGAGPVVG